MEVRKEKYYLRDGRIEASKLENSDNERALTKLKASWLRKAYEAIASYFHPAQLGRDSAAQAQKN